MEERTTFNMETPSKRLKKNSYGYLFDATTPLWKNDLLPNIFSFIIIKDLTKIRICSKKIKNIIQNSTLIEELVESHVNMSPLLPIFMFKHMCLQNNRESRQFAKFYIDDKTRCGRVHQLILVQPSSTLTLIALNPELFWSLIHITIVFPKVRKNVYKVDLSIIFRCLKKVINTIPRHNTLSIVLDNLRYWSVFNRNEFINVWKGVQLKSVEIVDCLPHFSNTLSHIFFHKGQKHMITYGLCTFVSTTHMTQFVLTETKIRNPLTRINTLMTVLQTLYKNQYIRILHIDVQVWYVSPFVMTFIPPKNVEEIHIYDNKNWFESGDVEVVHDWRGMFERIGWSKNIRILKLHDRMNMNLDFIRNVVKYVVQHSDKSTCVPFVILKFYFRGNENIDILKALMVLINIQKHRTGRSGVSVKYVSDGLGCGIKKSFDFYISADMHE